MLLLSVMYRVLLEIATVLFFIYFLFFCEKCSCWIKHRCSNWKAKQVWPFLISALSGNRPCCRSTWPHWPKRRASQCLLQCWVTVQLPSIVRDTGPTQTRKRLRCWWVTLVCVSGVCSNLSKLSKLYFFYLLILNFFRFSEVSFFFVKNSL